MTFYFTSEPPQVEGIATKEGEYCSVWLVRLRMML